jgi:hypothetical protein
MPRTARRTNSYTCRPSPARYNMMPRMRVVKTVRFSCSQPCALRCTGNIRPGAQEVLVRNPLGALHEERPVLAFPMAAHQKGCQPPEQLLHSGILRRSSLKGRFGPQRACPLEGVPNPELVTERSSQDRVRAVATVAHLLRLCPGSLAVVVVEGAGNELAGIEAGMEVSPFLSALLLQAIRARSAGG